MLSEKQKIEGYLAEKWNLQESLPSAHPYKSSIPLGHSGMVINGIPEKAGSYTVNVTGTNKWGMASETFNITVLPLIPESQTVEATQVGSTSARLQANVFDLGGADGNLSFIWGADPTLSSFTETNKSVISQTGLASQLLNGLSPSSTYYYRAKLVNEAGQSDGDAISVSPAHFWELNDIGSVAVDYKGGINGQIHGATSIVAK